MRFRKALLSAILVNTLVLGFSANAATFTGGNVVNNVITKVPTSITYEDLTRLESVATDATGKQAYIVNATKYNGSDSTWIVRLAFGNGTYENGADYVITLLPYSSDVNTQQVVSLPFKDIAEGTEIYGTSWFYFGLFDNDTHNICGYGLAERIKRWPRWDDLSFTGTSKRKNTYTGSYTEVCNSMFLADHIEKLRVAAEAEK